MSYADHLKTLREAEREADHLHPGAQESWREARLASRRALLGAHLPPELPEEEERILAWLAGWDAETVAGVAALMDRAATVEVGS